MAEINSPIELPTTKLPSEMQAAITQYVEAADVPGAIYTKNGMKALGRAAFHADASGWMIITDFYRQDSVFTYENYDLDSNEDILKSNQIDPVLSLLSGLNSRNTLDSKIGFRSSLDTPVGKEFGKRHTDIGDGHTFLANRVTGGLLPVNYSLGSKKDSLSIPHLTSKTLRLSPRDLLILGGSTVPVNSDEFDISQTTVPLFRTIYHQAVAAKANPRFLYVGFRVGLISHMKDYKYKTVSNV